MKQTILITLFFLVFKSNNFSQDITGKTILNRVVDSDPLCIINLDNWNYWCLYTSISSKDDDTTKVNYCPSDFRTGIAKINFRGDTVYTISFKDKYINGGKQILQLSDNALIIISKERNPFDSKEQTSIVKVDTNGLLIWKKIFKKGFLSKGLITKDNKLLLLGSLFDEKTTATELRYSLVMLMLDSLGNIVWTKSYEKTTSFSTECGYHSFGKSEDGYYFFYRQYLTPKENKKDKVTYHIENNGLFYYTKFVLTDFSGNITKTVQLNHEGILQDCYYNNKNEILIIDETVQKDTTPITPEIKLKRLYGKELPKRIITFNKYDLNGNILWKIALDKQNSFYDLAINEVDNTGFIVSVSTSSFFNLYKIDHNGKIQWKKDFKDDKKEYKSPKLFVNDKDLIIFSKSREKQSNSSFDDLYFMKIPLR